MQDGAFAAKLKDNLTVTVLKQFDYKLIFVSLWQSWVDVALVTDIASSQSDQMKLIRSPEVQHSY